MIRRWLERIADRFIDDDWLRKRREQEMAAQQAVQRINHQPPFEGDFFPQAPKRTVEGRKP